MLHKATPPVPPVGVTVRPQPPVIAPPPGMLNRPIDMMNARMHDMGMAGRQDFRQNAGDMSGFNPDMRPGGGFGDDMRGLQRDPRSRDPRDRSGPMMPNMRGPPPNMPPGVSPMRGGPPPQLPPHLAGADPEKAQLIMQVLQLTDEQIAMLPPEQRQSIMVLKEQISQGR
jgi:cleavage stimulation factor subunit 2